MNLKKSFAVCLSLLTFAPFSSHAMKESSIELINVSDKTTDETESSELLSKEFNSQNMNNFNINESIAQNNSKMSEEEKEAQKLGVRDLTCIICMNDENPDDLLGLKCRHVFHQKCLAEWTRMMEKKSWKCPVCQDILDPVRNALCQGFLVVEDFNTTKTEEENLLNILRNLYVEHAGARGSLNDINVFCSTEDIDVGVLYTMTKTDGGEMTRMPCVLRDLPNLGVFRVCSEELRDQFDALNNQAKSEVENWNEVQRDSFTVQFYNDFYMNVIFNRNRAEEVVKRQIRRLRHKCLQLCGKCTGLLLANIISGYLLYKIVSPTELRVGGRDVREGDEDRDDWDDWDDWDDNKSSNPITKENNQNSNQPN